MKQVLINYTCKAVLIKHFFNETFLVKDKSEILKCFLGGGSPGPPRTPLLPKILGIPPPPL